MFFSRKAKPLIDRVAAILASYFSIEADITAQWCADKLDADQAIGDKKLTTRKLITKLLPTHSLSTYRFVIKLSKQQLKLTC